MKVTSSIIICFLLKFTVLSQSNFSLKIKIESVTEDKAQLWSYYGNQEKFIDSIRFGANGLAIYKRNTSLPKGLYKIVLPNSTSFELIIAEQVISIETDVITSEKSMRIKKSIENKIYYDLKHFINHQRKQLISLGRGFKNARITKDGFNFKTDSINQTIRQKKLDIISNNPDLIVSAYIKAEMNPLIDQSNKEPYLKYTLDFLDQIDFNNTALLYSPILTDRIQEYLTDIIAPYPSEKIKAVDNILRRTRASSIKSFLATMFLNDFSEMVRLGDDEVFVHIVDHYLGDCSINQEATKAFKKTSLEIKPFLRGKQFPGNYFELETPLNTINAKYTLVVIWNKDVSQQYLNLLYDFSKSYERYGLKVLSIRVNTTKDKLHLGHQKNWYHGVLNQTFDDLLRASTTSATELIFLDQNKKIIARDISLDDLIDTLDAWEK